MTERIRLTVTITPEVHEVFSRMASVGGISLGRSIGDWLENTLDGAEFVTDQVLKAKGLPRLVLQDMAPLSRGLDRVLVHVMAGTMSDVAADVAAEAAAGGAAGKRSAHGATVARVYPPSSNTGGKGPPRAKKGGTA